MSIINFLSAAIYKRLQRDTVYLANGLSGTRRVTLTWAPSRLERGPYTGRGAKLAGLVNGRTRHPKIKEPARLL